jgi:hypothetical protein
MIIETSAIVVMFIAMNFVKINHAKASLKIHSFKPPKKKR